MPTILPMAVVTFALSSVLWCGMLYIYSGRTWRFVNLVWWGLPLSALVNLLVKAPLGRWVGELADIKPGIGLDTPWWFLLFLFALAPVFEELVKLLPAVLPWVRRQMADPGDAFYTGMALGIGFGLGEALYIAYQVASSGAYEKYPWYSFTGYFGERLVVVFLHGFMTALFLWFVARRKPVAGFLIAALTHAVLNSGAMLYQLGLVAEWVASAVMVTVLIAAVLVFEKFRPRAHHAAGRATDTVFYSNKR